MLAKMANLANLAKMVQVVNVWGDEERTMFADLVQRG